MVVISVENLRVAPIYASSDPSEVARQIFDLATGDIVVLDETSAPVLVLEGLGLIPFLRSVLYDLVLCNLREQDTIKVPIEEQDGVVVFGVSGRRITKFVITTVMGNVLEEGFLGAGLSDRDVFGLLETILLTCRKSVKGEWSYIFSDPLLKDMYARVLAKPDGQPA
jgi:hypothetical protein